MTGTIIPGVTKSECICATVQKKPDYSAGKSLVRIQYVFFLYSYFDGVMFTIFAFADGKHCTVSSTRRR